MINIHELKYIMLVYFIHTGGAPIAQLVECVLHVLRPLVVCSDRWLNIRLLPICYVSAPLPVILSAVTIKIRAKSPKIILKKKRV